MSKKLGKLKTFELLDTLNWEFIREYIILNQSIEEKDEEIKLILDCIKKDARIAELEKELEDARLSADFYMKSSTGYTDEFNKLKHENFELEEALEQAEEALKKLEENKND